jgi:DNA-directed RNA polymerase subunit RPC12/RpoP
VLVDLCHSCGRAVQLRIWWGSQPAPSPHIACPNCGAPLLVPEVHKMGNASGLFVAAFLATVVEVEKLGGAPVESAQTPA